MRILAYRLAVLLGLVVAVAAAMPVMAADGTTVDLTPVLDPLLAALGTVLSAAAMWLISRAMSWLKIDLDAKHRAALKGAVETGIRQGFDALMRTDAAKSLSSVDLKYAVAKRAADYVLEYSPQAAKRFGFDFDSLTQWTARQIPSVDEIAKQLGD